MFEYEATVDASDFLRDIDKVERRLLDAARFSVQEAAEATLRAAKDTDLFQDRTGELRRTMEIVDTGAFSKRVTTRANHARWVNFGTRAHVITPKTPGGRLRFFKGGRTVFAQRVNHPGTAPRPFMENAAYAGQRALEMVSDMHVDLALDLP